MLIFHSQGMLLFMEISQLMLVDLEFTFQKNLCFEKIFNGILPDSESLWVKVKFPNSNISHLIGTIYRHPTKNIKGFTESLNNILSKMNKSHVNYFILGDLNIDTDKFAAASNYSSDYLNMLTSNSVTSLITKPTRVTPSTAAIIDHVLSNENRLILTPLVIKYPLTDH